MKDNCTSSELLAKPHPNFSADKRAEERLIKSELETPAVEDTRPLNVIILAVMYPSRKHPYHGVYVENQVRQLQTNRSVKVSLAVSYDGAPGNLWRKIAKYLRLHVRAWTKAGSKFDLAHLHYPSFIHLIAAWPALFLRRKPIVVTVHHGDVYGLGGGLGKAIVRNFLIHRTEAIIAVSDDLRRKLILELEVPPDKIRVINVGCDMSRFKPFLPDERAKAKQRLGFGQDKFRILFVGDFIIRKGLDVLLRAMSRLEDVSKAELLLIGSGPAQRDLMQQACSLGIAGNLRWIGKLPNTELPLWYAASDVFVLPSRSEGTPTVILESMASGTPIIATRVGGIPEVITDEVSGLLFDSDNVDQLRDCLQRCLTDPDFRNTLAGQASLAAFDHSLERQAKKILTIYQNVFLNWRPKSGVKNAG